MNRPLFIFKIAKNKKKEAESICGVRVDSVALSHTLVYVWETLCNITPVNTSW